MTNIYEQQALDFSNVPIIQRNIKSSVHLEDYEDVLFWDTMIQRTRPGLYNYIYYSKGNNGKDVSGCDQCLKYKDYLNARFFICIDSDLKYLLQEPGIDAPHHIGQTYTYSWESHYCEAQSLQNRLREKSVEIANRFDFISFLNRYSSLVYEPLLALLYCLRNHDNRITIKLLRDCLPNQCRAEEIEHNGVRILDSIASNLSSFMRETYQSMSIDMGAEKARYRALGLEECNAYLHIRGHNLYNLVKSIGNLICTGARINFENEILNSKLPPNNTNWELQQVNSDLSVIIP